MMVNNVSMTLIHKREMNSIQPTSLLKCYPYYKTTQDKIVVSWINKIAKRLALVTYMVEKKRDRRGGM